MKNSVFILTWLYSILALFLLILCQDQSFFFLHLHGFKSQFLFNNNHLYTVIWFLVFLSNTNSLLRVIWFWVFLFNTNNFQANLFDLLHYTNQPPFFLYNLHITKVISWKHFFHISVHCIILVLRFESVTNCDWSWYC